VVDTLSRHRAGRGRLGESPVRPDGVPKVQGRFAFSSDAWADGMLWGATLRSPHPYARIVAIDLSGAWALAGVEAVIIAEDVPGRLTYGLISQDQPVFAVDVVRYVGEPVAAVAADHPIDSFSIGHWNAAMGACAQAMAIARAMPSVSRPLNFAAAAAAPSAAPVPVQ